MYFGSRLEELRLAFAARQRIAADDAEREISGLQSPSLALGRAFGGSEALHIEAAINDVDLRMIAEHRWPAMTFGIIRLRIGVPFTQRSEEHTSELQSQSNLVCR